MSFEDKCSIIGVAPLESGMCVATAAGEGGAIVPITGTARRTVPPAVEKQVGRKKHTKSRKLADEILPVHSKRKNMQLRKKLRLL